MDNPNLKQYKDTVGILIYHRTPELVDMGRDCLASIKNSTNLEETEIIIVDNGSTVRYDWASQCNTYIRFNENKGVSRGWNAIIQNARADMITILGDDTIVHKGFLEALGRCFEYKDCGVANIHMEHLPHGQGMVENYKWPSGACFTLSKSKTVDNVGLFDQDTFFPTNWEDLDYWLRCYKAGLKMYRNYTFSIQHREGATAHATDLSMYSDDNKRRFIKKWGRDYSNVFFGDEKMPAFTT